MLRRDHLILVYSALVVAWVCLVWVAIHFLIPAEGRFDTLVEILEILGTVAGGVLLVVAGARHLGREQRGRVRAELAAMAALGARAKQQAAVAALGQRALEGASAAEIASLAVETIRETLDVDACAVLRHAPREGGFRLFAGTGFDASATGRIVVSDTDESVAGRTVITSASVLVDDLAMERRLGASRFLLHQGVASVVSTPVRGFERSWGVLAACHRTQRTFTEDDAAFVSSVANVVAGVIERERVAGEADRFFDHSRDFLVISDLDGRIRRANAEAGRAFGVDPHAIVGRPYLDFVHPEDRRTADPMRLAAIAPENESVEVRCLGRDGAVMDVDWVFRIDFERRLIYAVGRDVSERKRIEADNALLVRAVGNAAETIVVTDAAGRIEYVNPAFERVTGYRRADAVGRTPRILKSGRHEAAFYDMLWAKLLDGQVWSGRFTNRRKDGSLYHAEGTIAPVRDEMGRTTNYVGVMRDVTHEAALEAKFRQAQKMEVVGRLAGGVAHDFNNLLVVIEGYADLLRRRLGPDHDGQEHLEQILAASHRAAVLTRRLLAFSRKQDLHLRSVDVNAAVRESSAMWERLLGEDVRLVKALGDDAGCVRADPGQLDQVLMNLAVNARDAMPGGGTLTIATCAVSVDEPTAAEHPGVRPGPFVRLSVMDTGVGMDAATMARLFEPFFTTKGPGKGSGLGLATVYGIVEQCGGFIDVQSEFGRGATFAVYLPRAGEEPELEPEPEHDELADTGPLHGTESVIVAEDDDSVRSIMVGVLRTAGYTVTECPGALEAVATAEAMHHPLALLVTDVVMPDGDGPDLAARVLAAHPGARVLFVTGHPDETIGAYGIPRDDVEVLRKPFVPDAFLRRVRDVLDAPRRPIPSRAG